MSLYYDQTVPLVFFIFPVAHCQFIPVVTQPVLQQQNNDTEKRKYVFLRSVV